MRLTIIGGHGKVALLAAPILKKHGHEVRSVIRVAEQAEDILTAGARPVVADMEEKDTREIAKAISGSDAVIWSCGAGGGNPERTYAVDLEAAKRTIDAAVSARVKRFIMVSYSRSGRDDVAKDDPFYPYADAKAKADDHLRASKLKWTILGPARLTDEPATSRYNPGATEGEVSRANVAKVIAAVLKRDDMAGVTFNFTDGDVPLHQALDHAAGVEE